MADGGDQLKKKLLGWMQNTLNKVTEVIDEEQVRPAPPQPPAPEASVKRAAHTGQLSRPGSDTFSRTGPIPPAGGARPGTDTFARAAAPRQPPSPLPGQALGTGPLKSPEEEAAESKKRMGFIVAYMKDPASDPAFTDKPLVYRILTEERSYQQKLVSLLDAELAALLAKQHAALDDPDAEAHQLDLQSRIEAAKTRQSQLFVLMKKLTGVRGKTGGTGFLAPPQGSSELPPLPGPPPF